MRADILIGVDLNKGYENYSEIKNLVNIFNASEEPDASWQLCCTGQYSDFV